MAAEWEHAINAYEVLGLAQGPTATDAEISKAYRAAALRYHPDKHKGDVEGAKKKFQAAKDARDLLTDAKARAALDALLGARAAREAKFAGQDEKRRRMREKLERDEKATSTGRNEEAEARSRLQAELGRLKCEAAARRAAQAAAQQAAQPAAAAADSVAGFTATPATAPPADAPPVITEDLLRTLKVSWSAKAGTYTSQQLRDAFATHGPVEDVILRGSRRKSKGSALVVMGTRAGAAAAAAAHHGDPVNPLLVVPFLKVPVEATADGVAADAEPPQQPAAVVPDVMPQAASDHAVPNAAAPAATASAPPCGSTSARAAPLFPLDDATTTGPSSANGWATGQKQAPLFPSFGGPGGTAPAAAAAAAPAGVNGGAAPLPTASSVQLPTGSSFRPPPGGLFNAGVFGAAPRPPFSTNSPAAPPSQSAGAAPARGTAVAPSAANGLAGAASEPAATAPSPQQQAAAPSGQQLPGAQPADRAYETPAQADVRRAAERARLIAEMEAEDAAEAAS